MDIRSKNSRKAGVIAVVLLLAFCALAMLRSYPEMSSFLESEKSDETMYMEGLHSIGSDLAEGNYILYNEYARETDPGQVLDEFGQRPFDLVRKYMDCAVFAEEDAGGDAETAETSEGSGEQDRELSVRTENLAEDTQELLTAPETDHYAFRAEYRFSGDGMLSGVQVDGTVLSPEDAYNLENNYIRETEIEEDNYGISSISVPAGVTVIYGMTKENLDAYIKATDPMYPDIYSLSSSGAYRDTLEVLGLLVIAAALLLPLVRRLDISGMKMFAVPFEIPVLVLFLCFCSDLYFLPMQVVYGSLTGSLLPTASTGGLELPAMLLNFFMWTLVFGVLFWAVTSLRAIVRMKGAYWRERTLTYRLICHIRNRGDEYGGTMTKKAGGAFRKVKSFISRQYDALLHLDFQDKTNRTILKVVVINFLLLCVVCAFWYYGIFALIVYSVLLFLFLRKYTKDLQEKYKMLLKSTNQLADGHLDVPIEGDIGLFNPIQEELKKIQKGFKKAVDEEVKNERMKTELVTNVSHDLRTPLTAITGWSETLMFDEAIQGDSRRGVEIISAEAGRLTGMVEELLEFTRLRDGRFTLNLEEVELELLLEEVAFTYGELLKHDGLELIYETPEEPLLPVTGDPARLKQVLLNILDNAAKYGKRGKRIELSAKNEGEYVKVMVRDHGPGFADEDLPHVKERFYKGRGKERGSGIGLAVCDEIVTRHRGRLTVGNCEDGGGLVTVELPVKTQ